MNKNERSIVLPITFGSMFEWYEVFLFFYWSPIIAEAFFDLSVPLAELIYALIVLSSGLIARPIGGMLFGYIGDRYGRRISFLISILCMILPSIGIAVMDTFSSWAYFSIVYVGIMRFLQGIPAGGELPGALCLLAEGSKSERRRYLCSYLFVGPQIGQIISMLQCLILQVCLSHEQLVSWGWRLSFLIGSAIGILGFFLRKRLNESSSFEKLKTEQKIEHHPLKESFKNHKKNILIGLTISIFEVIGFFIIYFYLLQNSETILDLKSSHILSLSLILLTSLTILMPIIGFFANNMNTRFFLKLSAIGVIIFSLPFYFAINAEARFWTFLLLTILILLFCIQFSLLPSFLVDLFPTRVRFTCLGFSFNISDGVIGGIIPFLSTILLQATGNTASFVMLFPISAVIFLISLHFVKENKNQSW